MKILKQTLSFLSVATLAVCCGLLLLFGWSETGWKVLTIPTNSMRPVIPSGSLVLMHRVPASSLKVGDVITYTNPLNPKTTVSHRIIKKYLIGGTVPGFITKGDANKIADVPIVAGSVLGKVTWHIPRMGTWLSTAKRPIIILPIVYIASLLIIAEEVIRLRDYYKNGQPYRLAGYKQSKKPQNLIGRKIVYGATLAIILAFIGAAAGPIAHASLTSNTVSLLNNNISVAPVNKCTGNTNNNTSVNIDNNNDQTATSGNSNSSSGETATSGNSSNNSSTNINVTVTNC